MYAARADIEVLTEALSGIEGERVIALHPKIASDYRREVAALNKTLSANQTVEAREEVIPRLRALIDSIVLVPSVSGHGVDIEVGGRLARMIEFATGKPLDNRSVIAMERVKGISRYHPWPRASV